MIWHPLSLSLVSLDLLTLYFLFWASISSARIVLNWSPGSATREQILLESAAETASIQGRICLVLQLFSFILLLFAIASVFPKQVPGAMCGTGVLQASGETGVRMLLVRSAAFLTLFIWYQLDRNNRLLPEGMFSVEVARMLLLSTPFVLLAMVLSVKMLWQLNVEQVVDCCAVVYDQFVSKEDARTPLGLDRSAWLSSLGGLSALLGAGAVLCIRRPQGFGCRYAWLMLCSALLWCVVASIALMKIFSSYHYGVLYHHCPWCLFLPEHYSVGYPLFFAIVLLLLSSIVLFVNSRTGHAFPLLYQSSLQRVQQSGRRILGAMLLYFLFAVFPALLWKFKCGVWIG